MPRSILPLILLIALASMGNSQSADAPPPVFLIHGPTIVAFFPPTTQSDLDSSDGVNEALSDFEFYVDSARPPLQKAGVDFEEAYARSFKIRVAAKTIMFRGKKNRAGYYFIAPKRNPHVQYGVMTDQDILDTAQKYFSISIPREPCRGSHCPK